MSMEYKQIIKTESWGSLGAIGIQILVSCNRNADLSSKAMSHAAYQAEQLIRDAVVGLVISSDEREQELVKRQKQELIGLFDGPIFVEEIPNGYSNSAYCRHFPWFVVTTKIGRFKLGWRKRVIELDWSATVGTQDTDTLFPKEEVTKGGKLIHAWSLDDAKRYIDAVIQSAETKA